MIDEGVGRIVTAPYLAIVPGAMLVLTVLSLNIFGDGRPRRARPAGEGEDRLMSTDGLASSSAA